MDLDPGLPTIDVDSTVSLNAVLSALVDVDVDLGVDEHLALATVDIELGELLAQLRIDLGLGEDENLLDLDITVGSVLHAMATVAAHDGNLSAAAAINALLLDLGDVCLGTIHLGDLFDISDMSLIDGIHVDLLDVCINMMSLWNQHHMVEPTTITIDGDMLDLDANVLSAQVDIDVHAPPHIMIGDEISAEMGNIEIQVHAALADVEANLDAPGAALIGAKLVLGHIDLCVFAPWVSARADVLDDQNGAAMLDADVGRISMCIGKVVPGALGEGSDEISLEYEVEPSVIGEIVVWIAGHEVPIAKVKARAVATVEAHVDGVLFDGDSNDLLHLDFGTSEAALWEQLFANIEITVEPLGIPLAPIQIIALQNAVASACLGAISLPDLLDCTALPVLDVLGSGLTGIDINVGGILTSDSCGGDGDGIDVDVDVDVDTDTDVDVSVDEDIDVSVDMDTDVGVDVDMDCDCESDGDIDADADVDVDVDADDDGVNADVDAHGDVHADVADTMVDANADANGRLNLAGGGCSVGGPANRSTSGLSSLALLGLVLALRARRKASRN